MWRLVTSETVVGHRTCPTRGVVEMRSVETSDQAMGPGAGTRHLLSLAVQDFEEVVKVTKPEPDLERIWNLIAKTEAVKVLDHDMVMEVEVGDIEARVRLRWKDVKRETFKELVRKVKISTGEDEGGMVWSEYLEEGGMELYGRLFKGLGEWRLVDGEFKVEVEIETLDFTDNLKNPVENAETTKHWLLDNAFSNQMATADFALVCEDELVPCHRFVLRAASEGFRGMLEANTKEAKEGRATIQCRAVVARALVTFLYTGELTDTHLQELLRLADILLVEELGRRVEDRMVEILGRENMVEFLLAGDTHHGARIRRAAKAFIRANLSWLKVKQGWKEEFGGNLALIIELLE